jgi:hypothetical protein
VINEDGSRLMLMRQEIYSWNELTYENAELNTWASEDILPLFNFIVWRSCVNEDYGSEFLTR